jgi:hypothetical protein
VSPRDRLFWETVQRRAAGLQPDVARDVLRAFRIIRESLSDAQLARLIASGQIDAILDDALLDRAFLPLQDRIRKATERAFDLSTQDLPKGGKVDGQIAVSFDYLNPKVITAVRQLDSRVVQELKDETRTMVRAHVENGLRDGRPHASIARELRQSVGMSAHQAENAAKFRSKLEAKGIPVAKIDTMLAAYEKNAVSVNAKTIARTATLDSLKLGQRLSWEDAVAKGMVRPEQMVERWTTVGDDRVRDEHRAMNGEEKPFDGTYSNGDRIPGENEWNCRCVSRVIIKPLPKAA